MKNLPTANIAQTTRASERVNVIIRTGFNGKHNVIKFKYPAKVITSTSNDWYTSRINSPFSLMMTKIKAAMKSTKARGNDLLITLGKKFPLIWEVFGSNVRMKDGIPITNISKSWRYIGSSG